MEFPVTSI